MTKKIIGKILLFGLIFCVIWYVFQKVLEYKFKSDGYFSTRYEAFENEPEGSVDILYLGTSSMLEDINPTIVWNEEGITGFNLGVQVTAPASTYYQFLYAIKHHIPKVVMLDLSGLHQERLPDDTTWEFNWRNVYNTLPDKEVKKLMLADILDKSAFDLSWYFPLLRYHGRWNELNIYDFDSSVQRRKYPLHSKGSLTLYVIEPQSWPENYMEDSKEYETRGSSWEYYQKIVDVCKEKNIEVIVAIPPAFTLTCAKLQQYTEFCNENEIEMLCFENQEDFDEIGLDIKKDFYDEGHLNAWGQEKYSRYIAQYLRTNYELPDHRNDSNYEEWDRAYLENSEVINETIVKKGMK